MISQTILPSMSALTKSKVYWQHRIVVHHINATIKGTALQYLVNGHAIYITSYTSHSVTYWRGRYTDNKGKRHALYFGRQDPRSRYIPIPSHKNQRDKLTPLKLPRIQPQRCYMLIEGYKALVRAEYSYCSNSRCTCRKIKCKHGPYYKAYYWDKEAKKTRMVSLGKEPPDAR